MFWYDQSPMSRPRSTRFRYNNLRCVFLATLFTLMPGMHTSDIFLEAHGAITSVLLETWNLDCTIVFLTERDPHEDLDKIISDFGLESKVSVFESWVEDQENTTELSASFDDVIASIKKVRQSSICMTLILASDDNAFVEFAMKDIMGENVLAWPAKLILVSRHSMQRIKKLGIHLSSLNSVVINLEKQQLKRCGVYTFLPYSQRLVHVASWTAKSGLKYLSDRRLFPDKFRRLEDGTHFKVAAMRYPPHFHVSEVTKEDGTKELSYSGPLKLYMDMLKDHVNFTYSIVQPTEGAWGFVSPNGTWNGMIGMLLRKEVDLALGPFARIYIRAKYVDYADTLMVLYAAIVGRRGDTEVDPWSFIMPLAPWVWGATFITLGVILILLVVVSKYGREKKLLPLNPQISMGTYIRAFLQQNIETETVNEWERLLLGGWMLTVLVLLEAYSTNLISLLAVRHIIEPYHYVREVMDDPTVKMIWFANSAYLQFVAAADSGVFQEVHKSLNTYKMRLVEAYNYVQTVDEMVGRGDHVVIHPYLSMRLFLTEEFVDENGNCKFYVSDERFMPMDFSPIVPKYSPLRVFMGNGVRASVEGGLYTYWLDSTMTNPKSCRNPPTKITVQAPLSLKNIWGMFAILVAGYIISILTFGLELASTRCPRKTKRSLKTF